MKEPVRTINKGFYFKGVSGDRKMMETYISIKLFATLAGYTPASGDKYPVLPGTTVRNLLNELGIPENDAKLIFINGIKGDLTSSLHGGERVGIFPPVGGG